MGDPVPVGVGWALWSKQPGAVRDYSVLATSGEPLSEQEFSKVLTHFMSGTPSTEPDSPPWVTISRVGVAEQVYLGLSIVRGSTGMLDGVGRPIVSTSYFCVAYDELNGTLFSYADLYRQLAELPLPYQGGNVPIQLAVRSFEAEEIARQIEDFGEATVRAAAAMLLSGPVCIVGADGTALDDRLRFLDAVAALLPYGYRAAYTAATWSDSATRHPIRLVFAERPRQGVGAIRWGSAPATVPAGAAETYLRLLRQIRDRLPDPGHLEALVRFMRVDQTICGFDQPQRAIDRLRDFGLPYLVLNAVREGTAKADELRLVFTKSRADDLTADERLELLNGLISIAGQDPQDWKVVDRQWERVVGAEPLNTLQALVKGGRKLLWVQAPDALALQNHRKLAADHDMTDDFLAQLIAVPGTRPKLLGGLQAAAQVLADSITGWPGRAALPKTGSALEGNPLLACALLTQLADAERDLQDTLTWLRPVLPPFLGPFLSILDRTPAQVDQRGIGQLAENDDEYVVALLTAASHRGRLELMLPGFTGWIGHSVLARGVPDPEWSRYWRARLVAIRPARPSSAAWLDLALLLSGSTPQNMLTRRSAGDRRQYNESFAQGWEALRTELGPAADNLLTAGLTASLDREPWARDVAIASGVTELARWLTSDGQRRGLRAVVSDALERSPEAARWQFAEDFRSRDQKKKRSAERAEQEARAQERPQPAALEVRRSPEQAPPLQASSGLSADHPILVALRNLRQGTPMAQVAELCVSAYQAELNLRDVCAALAVSEVIRSGSEAMAVTDSLRRALFAPGARPTASGLWLGEFIERLAAGEVGKRTGEAFRDLAIRSAVEEMYYHSEVLQIVAAAPASGPLNGFDTELLTRTRKAIDAVLPDTKKRSRIPFL